MKIYYLPASTADLDPEITREQMRRHHWHEYFLALRDRDNVRAKYHGKLARSLEKRKS